MKIELNCKCGSSLFLSGNHYINKGRKPDDEGRIFQVETTADKWIKTHAMCIIQYLQLQPVTIAKNDPEESILSSALKINKL